MSLTVVCLAVALAGFILAAGLGMAADSCGWMTGAPALIFVAIAAVALIFGIASYNENIRATSDRNKVSCVEDGNEVVRYSASEYCVSPGSKIIRML